MECQCIVLRVIESGLGRLVNKFLLLYLSLHIPVSLHPINKGKKAHELYKKTKSVSM